MRYTKASRGFPSSREPRAIGKCRILSHCETEWDPISRTQISGSQSAPVTLGRCRMSRRKRYRTKITAPNNAIGGGKPITLAIVGSITFITDRVRYQISDVTGQRANGGWRKIKP